MTMLRVISTAKSAYVDFSGNEELRYRVHSHLADNLKLSLRVGGTHVSKRGFATEGLAGPTPEFFFAPAHLHQRTEDLGHSVLAAQISDATQEFFDVVRNQIQVRHAVGADALRSIWLEALGGGLGPSTGHVVRLEG